MYQMPTARHKPKFAEVTRALNKWVNMPDDDFNCVVMGVFIGLKEFKRVKGLTWHWLLGFLNVCDYLRFYPTISETNVIDYMKVSHTQWKRKPPPQLTSLFERDQKNRYTLSPTGKALEAEAATFFRRVLLDRKEYYRLLYDRHDRAEQQKRQREKRFFALEWKEQINICRQFYAMPRDTPQERRARNAAVKYLRVNYDVIPTDLARFAQQYPIARMQPIDAPALDHLGDRNNDQEQTGEQPTNL